MRIAMWALLLGACGRPPAAVPFTVTQECRVRIPVGDLPKLDWLIVVDDSPAMLPGLPGVARLLDGLMKDVQVQLPLVAPYWIHLGVAAADPAGGAALRGGCGLGAGRAFIDDNQPGGLSNLAPGQTPASTLECLLPLPTGAAAQRPLETAWHAVTGALETNHEFRRDDALLLILWIAAADYAEDAPAFVNRFTLPRSAGGVAVDPYQIILESLSTGGANLHAVVSAAQTHVELPLDATEGTPLLAPLEQIITSSFAAGCLASPPADPAHPDCVVEDVTELQDGSTRSTLVPSCTDARWTPPCWELEADPRCLAGPRVRVRRPAEGAPPDTSSMAGCDCAANPVGS